MESRLLGLNKEWAWLKLRTARLPEISSACVPILSSCISGFSLELLHFFLHDYLVHCLLESLQKVVHAELAAIECNPIFFPVLQFCQVSATLAILTGFPQFFLIFPVGIQFPKALGLFFDRTWLDLDRFIRVNVAIPCWNRTLHCCRSLLYFCFRLDSNL